MAAPADRTRHEILLIGPVNTGKSTLGWHVSQRLGLPRVAVDFVRWGYYEQIGYDYDHADALRGDAFDPLLRNWKRFELYAVERILAEHADCVIDFGGRHSVYEDDALFERARRALAPFRNVVLILPSPNLDESVRILRERSRSGPPPPGQLDFVEHSVRHHSNHDLATLTVYTKDKTPEQTAAEIVERVTIPPEWRLPPDQRATPQRTAERATTLLHAGLQVRRDHPETARRYLDEALAIRRATNADLTEIAEVLRAYAAVDETRGELDAARIHLSEALTIYESAPRPAPPDPVHDHSPPPATPPAVRYPFAYHRTLEALARIERAAGNWAAASDWYARAAQAWSPTARGFTASALKMLSDTAREAGDLSRAEQAYHDALSIYRDLANLPEIASTQCIGGHLAVAHQDLDAARERYAESFAIRRSRSDPAAKKFILEGIARLAAASGDSETARALTDEETPLDSRIALAASFLERA